MSISSGPFSVQNASWKSLAPSSRRAGELHTKKRGDCFRRRLFFFLPYAMQFNIVGSLFYLIHVLRRRSSERSQLSWNAETKKPSKPKLSAGLFSKVDYTLDHHSTPLSPDSFHVLLLLPSPPQSSHSRSRKLYKSQVKFNNKILWPQEVKLSRRSFPTTILPCSTICKPPYRDKYRSSRFLRILFTSKHVCYDCFTMSTTVTWVS